VIELSLQQVADAVGGRLEGADPAAVVHRPAVLDSRQAEPGALFVAVRGVHVDGHDYVAAAVRSGAVAALASRPVQAPAVLVPDTVAALGRLAARVRRRLPGVRVVGLTGSQGKTSTKDLLARLLAGLGPVVAPLGSYNNEIGVPLTVLGADAATSHLVVEMGARGDGQIRYLCDIAEPTVGVVLNVGTAHLGEFGSRAAIARAKGELVEALPEDGLAVLNADDDLVRQMAGRTSARVVTFGASTASRADGADRADVRAEDVTLDDHGRPSFVLATPQGSEPVTMELLGAHQAANAAAAAAVALGAGVPLAEVAAGLAAATSVSPWRMERHVRADGVVVVNDAYNASPDAVRSALNTLAVMGRRGGDRRTVAVLGEMRELGDATASEHDAVGRLAASLGIDLLVVVGAEAVGLLQGARDEASWRGEPVQLADAAAAVEYLRAELRGGDVVLVKAARAAGLERVAQALLTDPVRASAGEHRDTASGGRRDPEGTSRR